MTLGGWTKSLLSLATSLAVAELALRVTGLGPWTPFESFAEVPRISDPHETLGWVNRPGSYEWRLPSGEVTVRIDGRGARLPVAQGSPEVGLFGGSFLFGFGLSDGDAVHARLARLRPDLGIRNQSVPGYGTLQAMRLSAQHPTEVVVYGLVDLHDGRNAAAWAWLHALDRASSEQHWGAVPGAWWTGEALQLAEPARYTHWPASEHVALVHLVEKTWISLHDRLLRTKSETTMQLVSAWRSAVEARGGRFVVALLHAPERQRYYTRRLDEEGVEWVDLRHARTLDWTVPGDGHPDGRIHAAWAEQLAEALWNLVIRAVQWVRWAVSISVLAVVWFGVLTPVGLVSRLVREDPLKRGFDPAAESYWEEREVVDSQAIWGYLDARDKLWLLPIVVVLLAVGVMVVLSETGLAVSFLYPLF